MQRRLNCLDEPNLDSIARKAGPLVHMLLETYNTVAINDGPDVFGALYPSPGSGSMPSSDTPREGSNGHPGGC